MNSRQIDEAMKKGLPVQYEGIKYDRILEYISWYDGQNKHHLSVGLVTGRSYVRVPAEKVELWEGST